MKRMKEGMKSMNEGRKVGEKQFKKMKKAIKAQIFNKKKQKRKFLNSFGSSVRVPDRRFVGPIWTGWVVFPV